MIVKPFDPSHLTRFRTKNPTDQVMVVSAMMHLHDHERCYTGFINQNPVLFAGIDVVKRSIYGRALGEAWIYLSPEAEAEKNANEISYNLAWKFKALLKKDDYYRIQAECQAADVKTKRLLRKLGLRFEAVFFSASEMETDTYLYARVYRKSGEHILPWRDQASAA